MTISPCLSRRVALTALVLSAALGTCPGQANAATFFNSFADVTATVSLGGGASWSDLGFAAGSSFLDATAQVATKGQDAYRISSVTQSVNREPNPPAPCDQVNLDGGIAPLIFKDGNGSLDYPCATTSSSMGQQAPAQRRLGPGFRSR